LQDELDAALSGANAAMKAKVKRKRRLKSKENRKLREKIALQMDVPNELVNDTEQGLFALRQVRNSKQLAALEEMVDADEDTGLEIELLHVRTPRAPFPLGAGVACWRRGAGSLRFGSKIWDWKRESQGQEVGGGSGKGGKLCL
jgi:hypothetical protein